MSALRRACPIIWVDLQLLNSLTHVRQEGSEEEDIEHFKGLQWRALKGDVRECA